MNQKFLGWEEVARKLRDMAKRMPELDYGQPESLVALADRIGNNGVIVADEVGMGKTRIAVLLAKAVVESGGRCAIVIPPGLSFQWQNEFNKYDTQVADVVRSLDAYYRAWNTVDNLSGLPWFEHPIVMVSHLFSNWRLGPNSQTWRWCLLPEVYAKARKDTQGRVPRGYYEAYDRTDYIRSVEAAAAAITRSASSNKFARGWFDELSKMNWPDLLDAGGYGKGEPLRKWLGKAVGLGLGTFDLVVIDEAHKNRAEDGGLSTVLDNIILPSQDCRRVALTATPVELDVSQWETTLRRTATNKDQLALIIEAAERYTHAIRQLRLSWRRSGETRNEYKNAARQFERALSPYLLRRDKRQDKDVLAFIDASGQSLYDYRCLREVAIELDDLDPAWRQIVCAAEALSLTRESGVSISDRRLRLTIGNGHGLTGVIDEALSDDSADKKQIEDEQNRAKIDDEVDGSERDVSRPSGLRSAWWASVLKARLADDPDALFDHPAIKAAVTTIEAATERGEKVLVFGRFTRPMRCLVGLLNARQMLRAVEKATPWPQSKVHAEEWSAVKAAHRQLSSTLHLDALDEILAANYARESRLKRELRDNLLSLISTALESGQGNGRYLAIVDAAIERARARDSGEIDTDEHQVALLARALVAAIDVPDWELVADANLAETFKALVDAAHDQDSGNDDDDINEGLALSAWDSLVENLRDNYTSKRGGFARLMYGETKPQSRRMMQLEFNRPNSFTRVLVAQSLVGREGLNLHESCRIVVLLHPEWNPGVVEQQIGRVDRIDSRWARELRQSISNGKRGDDLPRIEIRPIIFKGTYDEHNWNVLQERWDDLRAQLHGEVIPRRMRALVDQEEKEILDEIEAARPDFSPRVELGG